MFETPPFISCPLCGAASSFGILSIGGNRMSQRCQRCKLTEHTPLPALDKKVIYLDQFVISNVYKIRAGETLKQPHVHAFWVEFDGRITHAQISQVAIFLASNIHHDETVVSRFSSELCIAHDMFGGDASFKNSETLLLNQEIAFAKAFIQGHPAPTFEFNIDDALEGHRNDWLPHIHITANSDYSSFADGLRESRDRLHAAMRPLFEWWQIEKPTFEAVLKKELAGYGSGRIQVAIQTWTNYAAAIAQEDVDKMLNVFMSSSMRQSTVMIEAFKRFDVPIEECFPKLLQFWQWPELWKLPYHWISAHLFAATAARLAGGQKKLPAQGFSNDIQAISTYAPYVDAIFVDIDCENLLNDGRLKRALAYKARIFSKNTSKEFFDYLENLENSLSDDVKRWTGFLYGPSR